jgi:hypothetical protein
MLGPGWQSWQTGKLAPEIPCFSVFFRIFDYAKRICDLAKWQTAFPTTWVVRFPS